MTETLKRKPTNKKVDTFTLTPEIISDEHKVINVDVYMERKSDPRSFSQKINDKTPYTMRTVFFVSLPKDLGGERIEDVNIDALFDKVKQVFDAHGSSLKWEKWWLVKVKRDTTRGEMESSFGKTIRTEVEFEVVFRALMKSGKAYWKNSMGHIFTDTPKTGTVGREAGDFCDFQECTLVQDSPVISLVAVLLEKNFSQLTESLAELFSSAHIEKTFALIGSSGKLALPAPKS